MSGANTLTLSQWRIVQLNHGHLSNLLQNYLLGIISKILVYKKHDLM